MLTFRILGKNEKFDPLTLFGDAPFTQADFYGRWQESAGREMRRFVVESDGEILLFAQAIKFMLPFGKHYYYCPYGPVIKRECSDEILVCLRDGIRKNLNDGVFVRLDFTPECVGMERYFKLVPLSTVHGGFFQPRLEWGTDLTESDEERLAKLDKGTRYSINLARKEGVEVDVRDNDFMRYFDDFYSLMSDTSDRNSFALHKREYYEGVFRDSQMSKNAILLIAKRSGKVVGTAFVILYGKTAMYTYAATCSSERHSQPSYAVVWKAMSEAKKRGAEVFNFGGIARYKYTASRWEGLTQFKKKFIGDEIEHSDLADLITSPFWYWLYVLKKSITR